MRRGCLHGHPRSCGAVGPLGRQSLRLPGHAERLAQVERELSRSADVAVVQTERRGHAAELVAAADAADVIVVFSGDGGFNEALNGLDRDVPIGFVPGGGASVLPRALGLPAEPVAAARRIADAIAPTAAQHSQTSSAVQNKLRSVRRYQFDARRVPSISPSGGIDCWR